AAIALDDRVREAVDDFETRCGSRRCNVADRAERVVDLADVGRTQLETLRRVHAHRVEEFAADELDARDERLGCGDVLLDQRDAVDRILEGRAVDVADERIGAVEQAYTETLAGAVVLGDEAAA